MWLTFLPEDRLWRVLPFLVLAAVALWGLVAPSTQWRAVWGRQRRYRDVRSPAEQTRLVRRSSLTTLVIAVVGGVVVALLP